MRIANAIMQAAANVSGCTKDQDTIVAWLEYIRCTKPNLFNELIAKWGKDQRP
jgi:hypothetical protein